jgi:hypothetical protein
MNEEQWLTSTDPQEMLLSLRGNASDRKARLASVAFCQRIWPLLSAPLREAVIVAERHADGQAGYREMMATIKAIHRFNHWTAGRAVYFTARFSPGREIEKTVAVAHGTAETVAWFTMRKVAPTVSPALLSGRSAPASYPRRRPVAQQGKTRAGEQLAQCLVLRDIFGNPFRPPPAVAPAWLTPLVVGFAQRAYDERDFTALPIVAGALEDAGCDDTLLLGHLRGPGPHCRGCWALDALLARK